MALIDGPQEIPSEWRAYWDMLLAANIDGKRTTRRYPWRLPHMQKNGEGVSGAQKEQRLYFERACNCFAFQPWDEGEEPDGVGGYSRPWWFTQAADGGQWYFNYFMQQTIISYQDGEIPNYCKYMLADVISIHEDEPDLCRDPSIELYISSEYTEQIFCLAKGTASPLDHFRFRVHGWIYAPVKSYYIDLAAYEVLADWVVGSTCWNNQPPLGDLLCSVRVLSTDTDVFFPVGQTTHNICIVRTGGELGIRLAGPPHYNEDWRPFVCA